MNAALRLVSDPAPTPPGSLADVQERIYQQGRSEARPCRQLMTWLLDRRNLEAAWERVSHADGAETPGTDGLTCAGIRARASAWLGELADELYHRRYRPGAVRAITIPKPNKPGSVRRLGILNVRDRVVHVAVKQVLEPILDPSFSVHSFGFRPGRSVPGALAEALRRLSPRGDRSQPITMAVHADVADCFDTVDHALLLAGLQRHVADPDLVALVEQLLAAGGEAVRWFFRRRLRGLIQGSPLSPLLCNLALHPVDEALEGLSKESQGSVAFLRYADDLLLLGDTTQSAQRALECVRQVLGRQHQQLRDPRAALTALAGGIRWLGVRLQPQQRPWATDIRYGYVVEAERMTAMLERLTEMTAPPSERIDAGAFNLGRWLVSVNEQLREWRQAYLFADNAPEIFRALDEHARARIGTLLQAVSGVRGPDLLRRFRVWLPRGFWTWQAEGTRLVCLASLAPQQPVNLTRTPAWARAPKQDRAVSPPAAAPEALEAPRAVDANAE